MTTQVPTRLLTKRELWTIAIVLSTAIARDRDKLIRAQEDNLFDIYDRLRNAGESLYAITDYALNNWEHADRPASPAQTPPQTPAA